MVIERRMPAWLKLTVAIITILSLLSLAWFGWLGRMPESESTVSFSTSKGIVAFHCEVADTPQERSAGLMNRESLDLDSGMLFVFESPQIVSFWMKDTLIPLDMIFIDETGHVINICEAEPEPGVAEGDLNIYSSSSSAKWVVELNKGVCAEEGIVAGTPVTIEFK
jgi:hypothetical protein